MKQVKKETKGPDARLSLDLCDEMDNLTAKQTLGT